MNITEQLVEIVGKYIRTENGIVPLDGELGNLGLDSMGAINLLMDIEATFDFIFPDEFLNEETFKTTNTMKFAIEKLLTEKS